MRKQTFVKASEIAAMFEDVQKAAGHRDPSTTKLHDRRGYRDCSAFCRRTYGWVVSIILLVSTPAPAPATVLVLTRNKEEVALAADSKVLFRRERLPDRVDLVCKIYQVGDIFFGVSGLPKAFSYDFPAILADALRGSSDILASAKAAGEAARVKLVSELPNIKRTDPIGYGEMIISSHQAAGAAIAAIENGRPMAISLAIDFSSADDSKVDVIAVTGDTDLTIPMGSADMIMQLGEVPPMRSKVELAVALVQYEIMSGDARVGPPIDAVSLRPDGIEWARKKDGCPIAE